MREFISECKAAFGRLCRAIEFRILLALFFIIINVYPFITYKNLEKPWSLYLYLYCGWGLVIFVLFLLSRFDDSEEDGE